MTVEQILGQRALRQRGQAIEAFAHILATMGAPLTGNEADWVIYLNADEAAGSIASDSAAGGHDVLLSVTIEPLVLGSIDPMGQVAQYHFTVADEPVLIGFLAEAVSFSVEPDDIAGRLNFHSSACLPQ